MAKNGFNLQMIFVLSAILITTVIICVSAVSCSGGKLKFEKTFYFVYYRMSDNAISAGSLADAVSSYGGAGYILKYNDNYYITFSCYENESEAKTVCSNLKKRDLECEVLKIKIEKLSLQNRNAKKNQKLYLNNLNTLSTLSSLAYDCANGLDTGKYSQGAAKRILSSMTETLNGLLKTNKNNCFTQSIESILDDCDRANGGYLLSKNMRYIQISIADKILNDKLT